jgi:hypothetical protein
VKDFEIVSALGNRRLVNATHPINEDDICSAPDKVTLANVVQLLNDPGLVDLIPEMLITNGKLILTNATQSEKESVISVLTGSSRIKIGSFELLNPDMESFIGCCVLNVIDVNAVHELNESTTDSVDASFISVNVAQPLKLLEIVGTLVHSNFCILLVPANVVLIVILGNVLVLPEVIPVYTILISVANSGEQALVPAVILV